MKKQLIHFLIGLFLAFTFGVITSCSSVSPSKRYAREHSHREFRSWKDEAKKAKKAERKKVKEHWRNKHTW